MNVAGLRHTANPNINRNISSRITTVRNQCRHGRR